MKNLIRSGLFVLCGAVVLLGANALLADSNNKEDQFEQASLVDLYVFGELGGEMLGLINTKTDQLVQVDLMSLDGWPRDTSTQNAAMQHVWATPNGKTLYFTLDAVAPDPAAVVILGVQGIDWDAGTADLVVEDILPLDKPGTPSRFPAVTQTDPSQPIATWTQPSFTQAHGPTFRPHSPFTYFTHMTDNRIRAINRRTNQLLPPQRFGRKSLQTHGVNFNPSGRLALGTGYYYDSHKIDVYQAIRRTGRLRHLRSITLGNKRAYAAFTHYTYWLNNRYALTVSMQFGPTSLTPAGTSIIGPSGWLLDVYRGRAKQIIGTADSPVDPGIYRSASDLVVAGHKLYVAEEDTIDGSYGDDGFVSVFDISDIHHPRFLKRLQPGRELPADFTVAHGLNVTVDERYVYVASYASNYVIKIETETDKVVRVFGPHEGIQSPHGGFIAGQLR